MTDERELKILKYREMEYLMVRLEYMVNFEQTPQKNARGIYILPIPRELICLCEGSLLTNYDWGHFLQPCNCMVYLSCALAITL